MTNKSPKADIMIVDDTPLNLKILISMLKDEGFKVRSVLNGEMALTAARVVAPDLILLDINMPGMNGYQVCAALKADPDLEHIPVIFVSATGEEMNKAHAFELGAVDYIEKPFKFDEVMTKITFYLGL